MHPISTRYPNMEALYQTMVSLVIIYSAEL